jgi:hypothetical protein
MTLSHRLRKTVALAALTAIAGSAALTGAASAATVGQPDVAGPGQRIPIDFAGYKEPANKLLPKNFRIVRVKVEVPRGEHASVVLTAPKGFAAVTIGLRESSRLGARVADVHYSGKRSVRVEVFANGRFVKPGQSAKGTLYLLARRVA